MGKIKRIIPVNGAMHLFHRGNNCAHILRNTSDKLRYYSLIHELKQKNNITIFHYCLMDNHSHLIAWLDKDSRVSRFMQQLSLCFWEYYKKSYGYSGHLWQGRFKSNIIDTDSYLLQCGKYIELNPVRAGIVTSPQDYPFSSYNFYAKGKPDSILTPSPTFLSISKTPKERMKHYVEFVVDRKMISSDRLKKQKFIGEDNFIRRLENIYNVKNEITG